jgi:hypothetical protein
MKNLPAPKYLTSHKGRRQAGAYLVYFAMVGASIASAVTLVAVSVPLIVMGV